MSNGDSKLYLYKDVIELVLTTSGDLYVDNRAMNNRKLIAHKGLSNELYFTIRDRDRKLQNVFSETLRAHLINPSTKRRMLTRILENTSEVGQVKLTLADGDLNDLDPGLYQIYIARSDDELKDRPVYTDQMNNIRFDIEISDQVSQEPVSTQMANTFLQTGNTLLGDAANTFTSSALYGNLDRNFNNAQHTIAVYPEAYTGQVTVQASCLKSVPSSDDDSIDWFDVENMDITSSSNISHTTFQVNCNWVRILSKPTSGSIAKIMLRN